MQVLNKSLIASQVANLARQTLIFNFICIVLFYSGCKLILLQKKLIAALFLSLYFFCVKISSSNFIKAWLGKKIRSTNKAVLITGCDSGFGFNIAKRLSRKGFQVFAGCLSPLQDGGKELKTHSNIHCIKMDVSRPHDVSLMLSYVKDNLGENDLWAVINNAGISKGSEVEVTSMQKIEEVIDVNLLGTIRVTKAFLPLLRNAKGRVINVASAAGRLMMPGFVTYSTSKQAVIAFSDGLRLEMQKFGVSVVTIEPWMFRTRMSDPTIVSKHIEKQWSIAEESVRTAYTGAYSAKLMKNTKGLFSSIMDSNINKVIDDMEDAVISECPPYYYRPGRWYLNTFLRIMTSLPKPVADYLLCQFVFKHR